MPIRIVCLWLMALIAAGCGGRTSTPAASPTSPTGSNPGALQVAGTYQISQTGIDDTCGMGNASVSFTGTVAHTAGGTTFIDRHRWNEIRRHR